MATIQDLTEEEVQAIRQMHDAGEFSQSQIDQLTQKGFDFGRGPLTPEQFGRRIEGIPAFNPNANLEAGASVASSVAAEPIAGVAGLAKGATTAIETGSLAEGGKAGEETINKFRQALTFQPPTEEGQEALKSFGEFVNKPLPFIGKSFPQLIQEGEEAIGDFVFEKTDSPAAAAFATAFPTAALEVLGFKGSKKLADAKFRAGRKQPSGRLEKSTLIESAPPTELLLDTSSKIFKEIDNAGASLKPETFRSLADKLDTSFKRAGGGIESTPRASGLKQRFDDILGPEQTRLQTSTATLENVRVGREVPLTELDGLRKQLQGLTKSADATEKGVATAMVNTIDDFLDSTGKEALKFPRDVDPADIAQKYKHARSLWGRAKRGEEIADIYAKAARGKDFEETLRTGFRTILNNKKQRARFPKADLEVMEQVVRRGVGQKILETMAKLGVGFDRAFSPYLGIGVGSMAFGTSGALASPILGTAADRLFRRMIRGKAEFADAVIRAGADSKKIVNAYIKNTPKGQRSAEELAVLLTRLPEETIQSLSDQGRIVKDAKRLAIENRNALLTAGGTGAATQGASQLGRQDQESARTPFSGLAQSFGGR